MARFMRGIWLGQRGHSCAICITRNWLMPTFRWPFRKWHVGVSRHCQNICRQRRCGNYCVIVIEAQRWDDAITPSYCCLPDSVCEPAKSSNFNSKILIGKTHESPCVAKAENGRSCHCQQMLQKPLPVNPAPHVTH